MDESLESKQQYLREQILDKGYDPNQFFTFLLSKRNEEEANLETWSFPDLQNVVNEFIMLSNNTQQDQQASQPEMQDIADQNGEYAYQVDEYGNYIQPQDQVVNASEEVKPQDIYVECLRGETTEIGAHEDLVIKISDPEKVEGGLFQKSYVSYLITSEPLGYQVRKRYSDFEWLRNMLSALYPGSLVPPIPKKNYSDRFNETFLAKRVRTMSKFFVSIIQDPLIRNSQILTDFLTINDEKVFNAKKLEYNKLKPPSNIKEMKSLEGKVNLTINEEKENYLQNIIDNTNLNESIMKKLLANYKSLLEEVRAVSNRLADICLIWEELGKTAKQFSDNNLVFETYRLLCKLSKDWAVLERNQYSLLKIDIREYFKYVRKEFLCLKDLSHKADTQKNAYYKARDKLQSKKEDLFKLGNTLKWDLDPNDTALDRNLLVKDKDYAFTKMLPKDTNNVAHLKEMFAYYMNRVIEEYERIKVLNGKNHSKATSVYCQKHANIMADLSSSLAEIVAFLGDGTYLKEVVIEEKLKLGTRPREDKKAEEKVDEGKKEDNAEQQQQQGDTNDIRDNNGENAEQYGDNVDQGESDTQQQQQQDQQDEYQQQQQQNE